MHTRDRSRRMEQQQHFPSLLLFPHQNQAVCIQIAREESGAILTHSLHSARGYNLQLVHPAGHGMAVHITAIKKQPEKRKKGEVQGRRGKKEPKKEERICDLLHHQTSFIILVFSAVFSFIVVIGPAVI